MSNQTSGNGNETLQLSAGVFGAITILADVITIILFLRDAITGALLVDINTLTPRLLITAALFTLGLILLSYARSSSKAFEWIIRVFAWCYIALAATLLILVASLLIVGDSGGFDAYAGLLVLVVVIAGLGLITAFSVNYPVWNFAIPFMLAAAFQAFLWVYLVFDNNADLLAKSLIEILAPFLLTSALILVLLFQDRLVVNQNARLIGTVGIVALLAAAFLVEGFIQVVGTVLAFGFGIFVIILIIALWMK